MGRTLARAPLVLLVAVAASLPLEASDFGVLGGIGFHRPSISEGESFPVDGQWGLAGGGFFQFGVSEAWSLEMDVLVSQKSYSSPELVTVTPVETLWLDLPLLAELSLARSTSLYAGAQVSFRLRARREFRGEEYDVSDELQDADFGLVLGGRIVPLDRVSLEGRLEWGLRNIDATNWYPIRTRVVRILAGFRF